MMMKAFRFQQFDIQQSEKVFRVGTDGVLLGALAEVTSAQNILEIGTGTGLISLMLAQRNTNANILAIDIEQEAFALAKKNFENSPFRDRLRVVQQDFKTFVTQEKWDLIVSNPPYFEENSSTKDIAARQRIHLDFPSLISQSAKLLTKSGIFSVIIPSTFTKEFMEISEENNLFLKRKIHIYGNDTTQIKRHILEFSTTNTPLQEDFFGIEKSPRQYSEQYLEATKDFHIFRTKTL